MPFDTQRFLSLRPYVYHVTWTGNTARIRSTGQLQSAATLINKAGCNERLRERRSDNLQLRVGKGDIRLQSQSPLHAGNISFDNGWDMGDLVEYLNGLVFFWPGTAEGPNPYGQRHLESLRRAGSSALLRIGTTDLLKSNPTAVPLFCPFNSGSPRCVGARKSPRGSNTFLPSDMFLGTCKDVKELTFLTHVLLPKSTEFRSSPNEPWQAFFGESDWA
jgi:hypothetical protein